MPSFLAERIEKYEVKRTKQTTPSSMPYTHYHNHYEIYYLVKGKIRYFIENMTFDLNEGDIILIPPRIIHKTANIECNYTERLLISFTSDFLEKDNDDEIFDCFNRYYIKQIGNLNSILLSVEKENSTHDKYTDDAIRCYIKTFLIRLSRLTENDKFETSTSHTFKNITDFIAENYSSEITLDILSKKFSISKSHLSRQFKASTGFGINEYITLVRIKNAERMIINTDYPITEIATRCGFNDSSYFSSVFKKYMAISPLKLRKTDI